jgi:tripartite-type tricarboxylate transporter receptor subunit TctC
MSSSPNRRAILAAIAAMAWGTGAFAQGDTPLRLVVTFPPGGSTDIAARIIQPELARRIGRPVVVDNKPGAASQVATSFVAKAPPDGNTLLVSFDTHAINPIAKPKLPYDTFKDFAGVTLAVRFPLVIGASASVTAKDLRGFLEDARRQPAKFSYASTGVGSMNHLVMEDIKRRANVFVLHVPYSGGGPAVQAVLGDVSQLTLLSFAALKGQIAGGKIKPLAVTGAKRLPELPDRRQAPARTAGRAHGGRIRLPRLRGLFVDRHLRAGGHAARDAAQAHRRIPCDAEFARGAFEADAGRLRGDGHRRPGRGAARAAGVRALERVRAQHGVEAGGLIRPVGRTRGIVGWRCPAPARTPALGFRRLRASPPAYAALNSTSRRSM